MTGTGRKTTPGGRHRKPAFDAPAPAETKPSATPAPAAEKDGLSYRITSWKGLPNYECRFCPFATLDPSAPKTAAREGCIRTGCTRRPRPPRGGR